MRSIPALALLVLSGNSGFACDIGPQADVKLEPKDQAVLVSLGKAIDAPEVLKGSSVAALFSEPPGTLALDAPGAKTLSEALAGLRKATACQADGVTMERIVEDDTPGEAPVIHVVEKGDTLSAIAKKTLGDANRYMEIFEANKPMLKDPNKIYPGQSLRIPKA